MAGGLAGGLRIRLDRRARSNANPFPPVVRTGFEPVSHLESVLGGGGGSFYLRRWPNLLPDLRLRCSSCSRHFLTSPAAEGGKGRCLWIPSHRFRRYLLDCRCPCGIFTGSRSEGWLQPPPPSVFSDSESRVVAKVDPGWGVRADRRGSPNGAGRPSSAGAGGEQGCGW
jgi:hypothetical protein